MNLTEEISDLNAIFKSCEYYMANLLCHRGQSGAKLQIFTQPLCHRQDVIQGRFLSKLKLLWIQGFLSSRLVTLTKLKKTQSAQLLTYGWGEEDENKWILVFPRALVQSELQTALSRVLNSFYLFHYLL